MIDIGKILKRSWQILWTYKVLWIFGILLALTAGGNGGGNGSSGYHYNAGYNGSSNYNPSYQPGPFAQQFIDWYNQNLAPLFEHPGQHIATFVWIGVGFFLFLLILGVIAAIIHYVSENAVLRMVDEYEQTGSKVGFKAGWKMGWNRRAFRMWVIDLVVSLPILVLVAFLAGLGLLVFFSVSSGNSALAVGGTITAIGCAFLFILAVVLLAVFLGLLRQFFVRQAALEGAGIGDSFRLGWAMFKRNWKSAALMWLVMLGIGIGMGLVSVIAFFLLIPAYLILILPAAVVAAIPAAIAFGITSIFASGPLAWILAALVAMPFLLLIVFAPLALVGGWYKIYASSVWTLTYREIKALEAVKPEEEPAVTA